MWSGFLRDLGTARCPITKQNLVRLPCAGKVGDHDHDLIKVGDHDHDHDLIKVGDHDHDHEAK